jgi:hypothetical protein
MGLVAGVVRTAAGAPPVVFGLTEATDAADEQPTTAEASGRCPITPEHLSREATDLDAVSRGSKDAGERSRREGSASIS